MKAGIKTCWARRPETCKPDTYKRTPLARSTNTTSSWPTHTRRRDARLSNLSANVGRRSTKQHELRRAGWREPSHPKAKPAPNSRICAEDLYNKSLIKHLWACLHLRGCTEFWWLHCHRGSRKRNAYALLEEHWLVLVRHSAMHHWAVPVTLNVGFQALLGTTP